VGFVNAVMILRVAGNSGRFLNEGESANFKSKIYLLLGNSLEMYIVICVLIPAVL
jgi:hypothetical protein